MGSRAVLSTRSTRWVTTTLAAGTGAAGRPTGAQSFPRLDTIVPISRRNRGAGGPEKTTASGYGRVCPGATHVRAKGRPRRFEEPAGAPVRLLSEPGCRVGKRVKGATR